MVWCAAFEMAHGSPSPTRMLMICEPLELETAMEPYPRLATVTDWIKSGISAPTEITYLQLGDQWRSAALRRHQRASEGIRGHAEGTQRALREHSESTQRALRGHSESTQRALRGHSEGTQRALRGHSEANTHNPSVAVGMRSMLPQRVTMAAMVVEKSATHKKEATSVIG